MVAVAVARALSVLFRLGLVSEEQLLGVTLLTLLALMVVPVGTTLIQAVTVLTELTEVLLGGLGAVVRLR